MLLIILENEIKLLRINNNLINKTQTQNINTNKQNIK